MPEDILVGIISHYVSLWAADKLMLDFYFSQNEDKTALEDLGAKTFEEFYAGRMDEPKYQEASNLPVVRILNDLAAWYNSLLDNKEKNAKKLHAIAQVAVRKISLYADLLRSSYIST